MKFGKRLKQQIQETLPGWRDKFLSYKELKKLVRLISSAPMILNGSLQYGRAEEEFVYLLNSEIEKFNAFFMEQEEDFVIWHKVIIHQFIHAFFFLTRTRGYIDRHERRCIFHLLIFIFYFLFFILSPSTHGLAPCLHFKEFKNKVMIRELCDVSEIRNLELFKKMWKLW
jgi:hypothetical protein